MALFVDASGVSLSLDSRLRPQLLRHGHVAPASVRSPEPVSAGTWTHIAAVYDGKSLQLWQNGRKTAEASAPLCTNPVNSVSRIGNTLNIDKGFKGDMKGIYLEGAVRTSGSFRLLKD